MYKIFKLITPLNKNHVTHLYQICRHAGHSKWQNIRHIKAEKDGERAAVFTRLRRAMQIAVQDGKTTDPTSNLQLAHVIERARKANMPISSINNVLKALKQDGSNGELRTLEISGPGGSAFVINVFTSNFAVLKSNIFTILRKSKGAFSMGTIAHLFDTKSVIQTNLPENSTLEDAINLAIELEMEEVVQVDEDGLSSLEFTGAPTILNKLKTQLESRNYHVHSAEVNYSPVIHVSVNDNDLESVNWFYKKLEDIPEIVNIFDNIAWPQD